MSSLFHNGEICGPGQILYSALNIAFNGCIQKDVGVSRCSFLPASTHSELKHDCWNQKPCIGIVVAWDFIALTDGSILYGFSPIKASERIGHNYQPISRINLLEATSLPSKRTWSLHFQSRSSRDLCFFPPRSLLSLKLLMFLAAILIRQIFIFASSKRWGTVALRLFDLSP